MQLKSRHTEPRTWRLITGKKYTLRNESYRGCYRKNTTGDFFDSNEELQPQYVILKLIWVERCFKHIPQ
jgi:hypothetical protein